MVEYYQVLGENLCGGTISNWVDSQIQCTLHAAEQINFSEFQSFYLTYASADETEIFETTISTPVELEIFYKNNLKHLLITKDIESKASVERLNL